MRHISAYGERVTVLQGGIIISTVNTNNNSITLPIVVIMDENTPSYTESGSTVTDKNHTAHYCNNNQSLYIESIFLDNFDIQDLIKDYIIAERYAKFKVDDTAAQEYNNHSNEAVVTSTKEERE